MDTASQTIATAYAAQELQVGLRRIRLGCYIAMGMLPAGGLVDLLIYRQSAREFMLLRLGFSVAMLFVLRLAETPFGRRVYQGIGVLLALIPAACMALIIYLTRYDDPKSDFRVAESPYYAGLSLVLLAIGLVLQWNLKQSLYAVLLVIAMYLLAVVYDVITLGQWAIFATKLWFLGLTGIIVVIGNHLQSKLRQTDFELRYRLEESRKELKSANSKLAESNRQLEAGNLRLEESRHELQATNAKLADSNRQLEESNQRLLELDELKGRFFANISHELRTPLTLLLAPLEAVRQHSRLAGEPALQAQFDTMYANGMRLLKLINDLLDLVRLEAGKLRLHAGPVRLEQFMRGLVSSIQKFAEDRGLHLTCDIHPEVEYLHADADKLEKVFLNLLFNAVKFTPAGGTIRILATREGSEAVIAVADSGVGIAAENLPHLFHRFWQADTSSQRKYQGAGIGLALVRELVEAHGGTVSAQSELGHGTTITVRLPLREPLQSEGAGGRLQVAGSPGDLPRELSGGVAASGPAAAISRGEPGELEPFNLQPGTPDVDTEFRTRQDPWLASLYRRAELYASFTPLRDTLRPWKPQRPSARPKLVVADDEPDMLRFLRSQLEEDYEVEEATDGEQAFALASQVLPDVVLCDMMLPEKDGLEVCRLLRAQTSTSGIPFLMVTARADDETKLLALAAGVSDFLAKPFSLAELRLRLKNLVDNHRMQRELGQQNQKLKATLEELKETELQLIQAEKLASLGRMSAGIIHEVNNPLNFAQTGLFMLAQHGRCLPDGERAQFEEVITDIREGLTRVAGIVSDLRGFTHPQGGHMDDIKARPAMESALRFLAAEWKNRVAISNDIPPDLSIPAVRPRLIQVFVNLLQNSLDALRTNPSPTEPPAIQLSARSRGRATILSIRDNGPGIPPHHLAKVFDPFFTTKEVGQGTGLGLSICYRLLKEMGARISVSSVEGKFCEFSLEFTEGVRETSHVTDDHLIAAA